MGVQKINLTLDTGSNVNLEIVSDHLTMAIVSGYIGVRPFGYDEESTYGFIGDDGIFYAYGYEERYV